MVKILYLDTNGFCLWHKRLEKQAFKWPTSKTDVMSIGKRELAWLVDELRKIIDAQSSMIDAFLGKPLIMHSISGIILLSI